jgi:AmmeMemoRadiSam system protein B
MFRIDDRFHQREHAVEVELPLIRSAWPSASILPVEVPADQIAARIGRMAAQVIAQSFPRLRTVFLASSDLTHYGPNYGFAPGGVGLSGVRWAMQNDRFLIDRVLAMQEESIVPEVKSRQSACGAGAIAAMLAACRELGASGATLLRHTNSYETLQQAAGVPRWQRTPDNSVGYASIVVG